MKVRYGNVLEKCLQDLYHIKTNITIYNRIVSKEDTFEHFNFFYFVSISLFNDILSRSIRLLDKHKDSANFWYIERIKYKDIKNFLKSKILSIEDIEKLSNKLIHVRDKVHFHLDRDAILNPNEIWDEANIIGESLKNTIESIFEILIHLYKLEFSENYTYFDYDGNEINLIYDACIKSGNFKKIFTPFLLHNS